MKLVWNEVGERLYETGVRNGVLYVRDPSGAYPSGVAWNGLTGVDESPSGGEPSPLYADDVKYLDLMSKEEFGATITAYMYPDEFMACDGSEEIAPGVYAGQQTRSPFGFSYRTTVGNDVEKEAFGYKLHLVYGCLASPSSKSHSTINESPDAMELSWDLTTTPVDIPGLKPAAHIIIDSTKADPGILAELEDILYGTASAGARLPLPAELPELFGANAQG